MFYRLGTLFPLLLCLWALLVQPTSSSPLVTPVVGTEHSNPSVQAAPPPPLSHVCGGAAVPIDYDQPVCCMNGYVYFDGQPVEGATVTITAKGQTVSVETEQGGEDDHGRSPDDHPAHFGLSLSEEPLNIEPYDEVTITAEFNGIIKQRTFLAQSGAQQQDIVLPLSGDISKRADHAMAFDGQHVILFGGLDDGNRSNDTWIWSGEQWTIVSATLSPLSRNKHAMAYDSVRQRIVLFGGYQDGTNRFNDTWEWNGSTWANVSPAAGASPSPRTSHAMVYDATNGKMVLFGGTDGTNFLNDTWLWDGTTWTEVTPSASPSGRANHAMAYDALNQRVVLFGGASNGNTHLGDTWIWDGTTWTEANPTASPAARYQQTMEYDSANQEVVLFGGINSNETSLNDTWLWNGTTWTEREPQDVPPARREHAWAYDATRQRMVLFGGYGPERLGDTWEWGGENWELRNPGGNEPPPTDTLPIATINYMNPHDAQQGSDEITFRGHGADGDKTDIIEKYRWTVDGERIISTQANFTLAADDIPTGTHTIEFAVQDDEGSWSEPTQQDIYIRDGEGSTGAQGTWTHLIYAVADNDLDHWMGNNTDGMLYRLRTAGAQANVHVGILYDGPGIGDTKLYILADDGNWTEESWDEDEARMDEMETLRDFILWGYEQFDSDYYALSLADHANGIVGFGQDKSTDQNGHAFLTPLELREALRSGTNHGDPMLDVLHYDGCSFGLLEDAAIARGLAHYVVASPNTGWGVFSYKNYRQRAGELLTPETYARAIAQEYALGVEEWNYPYTISVFDMASFEEVNSSVSTLGDRLLNYVDGNQTRITEVAEIRDASQKYDSGGETTIEIDNEDSYVDLVDFASRLQEEINDQNVTNAAAEVQNLIENTFVLYEEAQSGPFYYEHTDKTYQANLDHAHGLGIFYPPRSTGSAYENYIDNDLFDTTANSRWTEFLEAGIPGANNNFPPGLSDDELLPPLAPSPVEYQLFLPSVLR